MRTRVVNLKQCEEVLAVEEEMLLAEKVVVRVMRLVDVEEVVVMGEVGVWKEGEQRKIVFDLSSVLMHSSLLAS